MKNSITTLLIRVAAVFLIALLCYVSYISFDLEEVFKVTINYRQWLGITVISIALFQNSSDKPNQNDSEGSQIS